MIRGLVVYVLMASLIACTPTSTWAAYYAFGDSLTDGSGADAPIHTNGYAWKLATRLGLPLTNFAHGGDMVPDQVGRAYSIRPAADDLFTIMLGVNDERIYGVDATKQGYFRDGLRALVTWLALGQRTLAVNGGVETGNSWTNTALYGIGRRATAVGDSKIFTNTGSVAYLSMIIAPSTLCTYTLTKDGSVIGSFDANAPGVTSYNGWPYSERLHRIVGLVPGDQIGITMTGGSYCYVEWFGDNNQAGKPRVFVGNVVRQVSGGPQGYAMWGGSDANVAAYNVDVAQTVVDLHADGLDVTLVDVWSVVNTTTDIWQPVDGIHPTQSGHNKMADTFYNAIMGAGPPPGDSFTFTLAPVYRRLNNGTTDGTFWIDDGASRKQLPVQ